MILIADSGGSKTDWRLVLKNGNIDQASSPGYNPYYQPVEDLKGIVEEVLIPKIPQSEEVTEIYFYGAGVSSE
ncbi:MAG TPA: N-acetylglucosamine kinase, partial [Chryseosolibacter sp.]